MPLFASPTLWNSATTRSRPVPPRASYASRREDASPGDDGLPICRSAKASFDVAPPPQNPSARGPGPRRTAGAGWEFTN